MYCEYAQSTAENYVKGEKTDVETLPWQNGNCLKNWNMQNKKRKYYVNSNAYFYANPRQKAAVEKPVETVEKFMISTERGRKCKIPQLQMMHTILHIFHHNFFATELRLLKNKVTNLSVFNEKVGKTRKPPWRFWTNADKHQKIL